MKRVFATSSLLNRSLLTTAVAATMLVPTACKKDGEKETEADEAAASADSATADATGPAKAAVRPVVAATRLADHDAVLGHVLLPNASELLSEVKNQLAVGQVAPFVDEGFLRGMLAGQLGERSGLAQNVELGKPIGCAVLSPKAFEVPAACHMSYKGGLDQMLADLGDKGKQADAAGHAAHYVIEGESLYLDTLGDAVVASGHPDVFAKAKSYLEGNLMGRAAKVASDIEVVLYAGATIAQYKQELDPVLEMMAQETQTPDPTGDPKLDKVIKAWADYNSKSTQNTVQMFSDMEQITVGVGLEEMGFVTRFAVFPADGSRLQSESKAATGPALNQSLIGLLPASSWLVVGGSVDRKAQWNTQTTQEVRDLLTQSYAELTGKNAAKVKEKINAFWDESYDLYTDENAFAFAHEPGTVGGLVMIQPLESGKSGRDSWLKLSKEFTPENVLTAEYRKYVTWSYQPEVTTVDGAVVDRITFEPAGKILEEMEREAERDEDVAEIKRRIGGFKLVMDRAEADGRVTFILAPGAEETYMKAALAAQKGTGNVASDPGLARISQRQPSVNGMFAGNVKGGANWLRELVPADKKRDIPENLGNDLGDIFLTTATNDQGLTTGEFVVSQGFIDQIRALAQKQQ